MATYLGGVFIELCHSNLARKKCVKSETELIYYEDSLLLTLIYCCHHYFLEL